MICAAFTLALATTAAPACSEPVIFRDCDDCPEMVVIPAGSVTMGADVNDPADGRPGGPVRQVAIVRPFALGHLEITNAQYARFVAGTGHQSEGACRSWDRAQGTVDYRAGTSWRNPDGKGPRADDEPVVCVSWRDAKAYAAWLSERTGERYRLPTEAEWEYAARAGSETEYPWGDDAADGCGHANLFDMSGSDPTITWPHAECDDGHREAAPVGSFAGNRFGLHDMIGNVWEWVEDCYVAPYPAATPADGSAYQVAGACERRSVRGGSWITMPFRQRAAWRGRDPEDFKTWIFGFRIARDLVARGADGRSATDR